MVANKGAGQDSFNPHAKVDIEAIRAKAAAFAAKNGTSGVKSTFAVKKPEKEINERYADVTVAAKKSGIPFTCN